MGGEVLGLLAQATLAAIGFESFWDGGSETFDPGTLFVWCLVGVVYALLTILWLGTLARLDQPDPPAFRAVMRHPLNRIFSTVLTFFASTMGIGVAIDYIVRANLHATDAYVEFNAILAMLLSWGLFHWGFARIYYARYYRATSPPMEFPGDHEPRIGDFVYFSFGLATSFAVADVAVTSSRMRWTVTWHSIFSFFFNALIIVLVFNVISNSQLLSELFAAGA